MRIFIGKSKDFIQYQILMSVYAVLPVLKYLVQYKKSNINRKTRNSGYHSILNTLWYFVYNNKNSIFCMPDSAKVLKFCLGWLRG